MSEQVRRQIPWLLVPWIALGLTLLVVAALYVRSQMADSEKRDDARGAAKYYCAGQGLQEYSDAFERCVEDNIDTFMN